MNNEIIHDTDNLIPGLIGKQNVLQNEMLLEGALSAGEYMFVPYTDINNKSPFIWCTHATGYNHIKNLARYQKSESAICCNFAKGINVVTGPQGYETAGDIICVVRGQPILLSNYDLYSIIDTKTNNRWVAISQLSYGDTFTQKCKSVAMMVVEEFKQSGIKQSIVDFTRDFWTTDNRAKQILAELDSLKTTRFLATTKTQAEFDIKNKKITEILLGNYDIECIVFDFTKNIQRVTESSRETLNYAEGLIKFCKAHDIIPIIINLFIKQKEEVDTSRIDDYCLSLDDVNKIVFSKMASSNITALTQFSNS